MNWNIISYIFIFLSMHISSSEDPEVVPKYFQYISSFGIENLIYSKYVYLRQRAFKIYHRYVIITSYL